MKRRLANAKTDRPDRPRSAAFLKIGVVLLLAGPAACQREQPVASGRSGHERMIEELLTIRERTADEHAYLGDAQLRHAEAAIQASADNAPPVERFQMQWIVGYHQARLGRLPEAIASFDAAHALWPQIRDQLPADARQKYLLHRAATWLRLGETQNCVHCQSGDSCILPLRDGGVHSRPRGIQGAIECLKELLDENPTHLTARWLLNISLMAADDYPAGVPEKYRVSPEKFRSQSEFPRFTNIAASLGVDETNLCGGTAIEDYDGDGDLDIFTTTWDTAGEAILFRNRGDGQFVRQIGDAGLTGVYGGLNLIHADYDNDGDVDILVLRGAWLGEAGRHHNSLLQNDGSGRFADVTFDAGLGEVAYPTQTAAWADFDNDGDLDLYIGNEAWPDQLFENDGRGHFTDVARRAGIHNDRFTKGVVWGDYDNDGFADVYVSHLGQENRLYHNNRDGTFTDVASELGVTRPIESFPVWFWDYNNDGALDLYVSSWWPDVEYVAAQFLDLPRGCEPACLYEGDGHGAFREVAARAQLTDVSQPMGANFGDLDNDGWLDMYLGTGYPEFEALMPNLMYRNANGRHFEDVTMVGGFGHLQKGHGVAFADLDNDGDQDLYCQMGGAFPGDAFGNLLFENPGFDHNWIGIQLVGTTSNRSAIGARIRIDVADGDSERSIYKWVNSGGSFGANPLQQQIGLGTAQHITHIEVLWPRTGRRQVTTGIEPNQFVEIREDVAGFRRRSLKSFQLTGSDNATPSD